MEGRKIPLGALYPWQGKLLGSKEELETKATAHCTDLLKKLKELGLAIDDDRFVGKALAIAEKAKGEVFDYFDTLEVILLSPIPDTEKQSVIREKDLRKGNRILNDIEQARANGYAVITEESHAFIKERLEKWQFPQGGRHIAVFLNDILEAAKVPLQPVEAKEEAKASA